MARPESPAPSVGVDEGERERFRRLAHNWWDERGPMRPLHDINPLRLDYIRRQWGKSAAEPADAARPLAGVRALDLGCGGGLLAEGLCRLGAEVLGVDATAESIAVARQHAGADFKSLEYREATVESLLPEQAGSFDLLCCLEVVEHVPDPPGLVRSCAELMRPGALAVFSTISRTPLAFATAIVGAEYILGLLPRGTHSYHKLVRPSELARWGRKAGLELIDLRGMFYNPLTHRPRLISSTAVNYLASFRRPA